MSRALENIDWGEPEPEPIPLKFSGSFEHLPATAPANHSHIIDLSSYDPDMEEEQYDVKVWDAVITILYKLSEETVSEFLSSSVKTFQLVHGYEKSRSDVKLVIWRQGSEVMVAQYTAYPELGLFEFDNLVRCRISFDGSWTIKATSFGKYSRTLNEAWAGRFITTRINREMKAKDAKDQADFARIIGEYIIFNKCWSADEVCKWTIKTT